MLMKTTHELCTNSIPVASGECFKTVGCHLLSMISLHGRGSRVSSIKISAFSHVKVFYILMSSARIFGILFRWSDRAYIVREPGKEHITYRPISLSNDFQLNNLR